MPEKKPMVLIANKTTRRALRGVLFYMFDNKRNG